jgi:hypothetical protein
MKKQAALRAVIKDGALHYFKPQDLSDRLKDMEGKQVVVRIEEVGDDVTANQRAYYFATNRYLIKEVEQFGGWDEDELDEFARYEILTSFFSKRCGDKEYNIATKPSIRDLDKDQMKDFISKWLDWLSFNHGIYVPTVEEILLSKYH